MNQSKEGHAQVSLVVEHHCGKFRPSASVFEHKLPPSSALISDRLLQGGGFASGRRSGFASAQTARYGQRGSQGRVHQQRCHGDAREALAPDDRPTVTGIGEWS